MYINPHNLAAIELLIENITKRYRYSKKTLEKKLRILNWFYEMCKVYGHQIPYSIRIYEYKNDSPAFRWPYDIGYLTLEIDLENRYGYLYETIPGVNSHELVERFDLNNYLAWKNMGEIIIARVNYSKQKPVAKQ